ncbi:hypothetical protein LJC31_01030 [Synergistaceae bacterium OttesenSCG-928-I11]|nr:hypothetical protein [Synergistaceae bacterium OttesenSCG-928-I11]
MKKLLAVLLVLIFAVCASAEIKEFKKFKVDLPTGWTAQEEGATVSLYSQDKKSGVSVTMGSLEGAKPEDVVKNLANGLKGSKPEKDEDDIYSFSLKGTEGEDIEAAFLTENGEYVLIMFYGTDPALEGILDSFEGK